VLFHAHNKGGHWQSGITMRKLRKHYWPQIAKDTVDYIAGCLACAQHGTALRSQTLTKVCVSAPMELLRIDFVGPFPEFPGVFKYILVIIDYFSRFVWAYMCKTDNQAETITLLTDLFSRYGPPVAFYADPGPHFGAATQEFVTSHGAI
jgi:hypothetical protein